MSVNEPSDAVKARMAKQTEGRRTPSVSSVVGWSAAEGCGEFCYSHLGCKLTMDDRGSRSLRNVGDNIRSHNAAGNFLNLSWMKFLHHATKRMGNGGIAPCIPYRGTRLRLVVNSVTGSSHPVTGSVWPRGFQEV